MLYETLSQPYIICIIMLTGLLCGFLFDITNAFTFFCNNNKIVKQISLFFATFLSVIILYFSNLKVNFGEIRFYILFVFLCAFFIQRFLSKKFIAKIVNKCYTKIENFNKRIKNKSNEDKKG